MSSDPLWKPDANGIEHPTQEALLAFIREQCAEREQNRIQEHLLAGCAPCNRLHTELKKISHTLNYLNHMSRYLYYPELQSNQVWLHMQRGEPLTSAWTGKRKRKFQKQPVPVRRSQATGRFARKTGLRYVSIPAAFAMFILFVLLVATLVYALVRLDGRPLPIGSPINIFHTDPWLNNPGLEQHQFTPTATVAVTMTPSPGVTVSPSPTLAPTIINGAELVVCSRPQYDSRAVSICGSGFKGLNKVWLEVEYSGNNSLKTVGPFPIDSAGEFKMNLFIFCKNSPVTVFAADKKQQPLTLPLTNIARPGCSLPTTTVTPVNYP